MSGHTQDLVVFWFVVGLRVFVPLLIPRFPLPAGIAAMIIDAVDQTVYQRYTNINLDFYQGYDKALDVYYLTIAYISTMLNWTNAHAFRATRFLIYWRLVGVFLFEMLNARAFLLIFTNAFEYVFLAIEGIRTRWDMRRMSKRLVLGLTAFIWIVIKLPQEYWIHIAQMDLTDEIKERPVLFAAIGLVLAAVIVLGLREIRRRAPGAEWSWRLDANEHERLVTPAQLELTRRQLSRSFFDQLMIEKIVMIGLISAIFGQILPGFDVRTFSLIIAIAVIIIGNTVISELLVRRGWRYANAWVQFLVMFAINDLLVWIGRLLMGGRQVDWQHALFFLFLISLLVTLYDRYRPYSLARFGAEQDLLAPPI